MSLCRLGPDSDLYIYQAKRMYICHFCTFNGSREVIKTSRKAMIRHVKRHVNVGDKVPQYVLGELHQERRCGWLP